ncbi:hypothetical protein [Gorillibacterium sp. sgz5001074]|uniref:hypothetical protein n=1 Tax=Gorillibacterium sp. sgz5001074 TaxID=3446695 RepID=UPI003F67D56C
MDIAEIKQRHEKRKEYGTLVSETYMHQHIDFLLQELEKLQRIISDHGPDGRNYTNSQYVELRQENERLTKQRDNFGSTLATIAALIKVRPDLNSVEMLKDVSERAEAAFLRDEEISGHAK